MTERKPKSFIATLIEWNVVVLVAIFLGYQMRPAPAAVLYPAFGDALAARANAVYVANWWTLLAECEGDLEAADELISDCDDEQLAADACYDAYQHLRNKCR